RDGRGIVADLLPPEYVAESLAGELLACVGHSDRAARVLIPHGDRARSTIADALLARGVEVIAPVAYRTVPAGIDARRRERLLADMPDVVTFASSSTASAFVDAFGEEGAAKIAEHAKLVSIGPQTTRTMEALDLPVAAEADPHDIGGMIDAILRAFAAR
ncbi:uroporphyrinogen-III synthase, partial [bacterium]|nr:uroporphyrinogen-III synthase [bacterium]